MSGKGSKPRPFSVDNNTFDNNWDNIFRKKPNEQATSISQAIHGYSPPGQSNELRSGHEGGSYHSKEWQYTIDGLERYAARYGQPL